MPEDAQTVQMFPRAAGFVWWFCQYLCRRSTFVLVFCFKSELLRVQPFWFALCQEQKKVASWRNMLLCLASFAGLVDDLKDGESELLEAQPSWFSLCQQQEMVGSWHNIHLHLALLAGLVIISRTLTARCERASLRAMSLQLSEISFWQSTCPQINWKTAADCVFKENALSVNKVCDSSLGSPLNVRLDTMMTVH